MPPKPKKRAKVKKKRKNGKKKKSTTEEEDAKQEDHVCQPAKKIRGAPYEEENLSVADLARLRDDTSALTHTRMNYYTIGHFYLDPADLTKRSDIRPLQKIGLQKLSTRIKV